MLRTIKIDLAQPLHLQIKAIERAALEQQAADERAQTITCLRLEAVVKGDRQRVISEAMIKALMKRFNIDQYCEADTVPGEILESSSLPLKYTLAEVTKTKSNFFSRNWGKLSLAFGITAVGTAGGAAVAVFLFGVATLFTGGIAAAVFAGIVAIVGVVGLVKNRQEQKQLKQQQAEIKKEKPFVEKMLEFANDKVNLKQQIRAQVQAIKDAVAALKGKKEDLKGFSPECLDEDMDGLFDITYRFPTRDFDVEQGINTIYSNIQPYYGRNNNLDISELVKQSMAPVYSQNHLSSLATICANTKKKAAENYIKQKLDKLIYEVTGNVDLSGDKILKLVEDIQEKSEKLFKKVNGWVDGRTADGFRSDVKIAPITCDEIIENVDAAYKQQRDEYRLQHAKLIVDTMVAAYDTAQLDGHISEAEDVVAAVYQDAKEKYVTQFQVRLDQLEKDCQADVSLQGRLQVEMAAADEFKQQATQTIAEKLQPLALEEARRVQVQEKAEVGEAALKDTFVIIEDLEKGPLSGITPLFPKVGDGKNNKDKTKSKGFGAFPGNLFGGLNKKTESTANPSGAPTLGSDSQQ